MRPSSRTGLAAPETRSSVRRSCRCEVEVGPLEERALLSGPGDVTAPTTTAAVVRGTLGTNNFYTTPVTIRLSATDPDDAASTLTTFYRIDNGALVTGNVLMLGDGVHTVRFFSKDPAGNTEATRVQTFKVDLTAPVVTAQANPTTLWPPNNKLVPVTVSGRVTDASGGVPTMVSFQVRDEYGLINTRGTARVGADGRYSFVVNLQASRTGQDKDGRLYTIIVTATDPAGNTGSARTFVVVPHDQGHPATIPGSVSGNGGGGSQSNSQGSSHGGNGHQGQGNGKSHG
jgi:hypothetical protein